jgi:hypothetical protein
MAVSNASTSAATNTAEREFVITRVLDAPHDLLVHPAHYGMSPDWPAGMLVTVTFAEHEGQVSHPPCGKTAASRHGGDRS